MIPRYPRYSGCKVSLYHRVLQWSMVRPQQVLFKVLQRVDRKWYNFTYCLIAYLKTATKLNLVSIFAAAASSGTGLLNQTIPGIDDCRGDSVYLE